MLHARPSWFSDYFLPASIRYHILLYISILVWHYISMTTAPPWYKSVCGRMCGWATQCTSDIIRETSDILVMLYQAYLEGRWWAILARSHHSGYCTKAQIYKTDVRVPGTNNPIERMKLTPSNCHTGLEKRSSGPSNPSTCIPLPPRLYPVQVLYPDPASRSQPVGYHQRVFAVLSIFGHIYGFQQGIPLDFRLSNPTVSPNGLPCMRSNCCGCERASSCCGFRWCCGPEVKFEATRRGRLRQIYILSVLPSAKG